VTCYTVRGSKSSITAQINKIVLCVLLPFHRAIAHSDHPRNRQGLQTVVCVIAVMLRVRHTFGKYMEPNVSQFVYSTNL